METKYPIVQFSEDRKELCCCYVLPVSKGSDLAFYSPETAGKWYLSNLNGDKISSEYVLPEDGFIEAYSVEFSKIMATGDCFRIIANNYYSTPFLYIGCDIENTHVFEYYDDYSDHWMSIRLSCLLEHPQSKTVKSEYIDANGFNHSLLKTRRKEFNLTTDFYPECVHYAIKEILLYPNLLVDDIEMFESGDYEIDWDGKDENDNVKATTKLSEQDINRFSIC